MNDWTEDVLGAGFEARTLQLPGGAEATLIRYTPEDGPVSGRTPVLYVHGFTDYFFQRHLAEAVAGRGYPFYAVDLRGHGRSMDAWTAAGRDANMINRLELYAQDLDAAADVIAADGHSGLALLGHSTGGLITSMYANARPDRVTALVLNSPWFDLKGSWSDRTLVTQAVYVLGRVSPRLVVSRLGEGYGRALHVTSGGEWEYDLRWKPYAGFPVRAGWLAAIRRGHRAVGRGLAVQCPVLVCTSGRTGSDLGEIAEQLGTDVVLDVAHMHARAPRLGQTVEIAVIEGGAHDLALSPKPAREKYLSTVLDWLDAHT
ncbi:alpha/beta hydrolase [Promicromonospora sukumoe]|uniref:Alpha-beta hydrolase superfamily lysophospholipase n=1 Tax=Promicromonospora sukumoe TaxID=88382 RepID=A0A7W3JDS6_9MICO|nr:alpha/beta hydrolase [Promicromonospora sukumoe]MBA8810995.1 alpha-beta hydrolase superfamily lysophospholipase [Promicromonospora sukumoe]